MAGQEKRQVRSIGWRPGIDVWLLLCSTRGMPGHNEVRSRRVRHYVPAQMESQLQGARMDLLALFRSLDRIPLPEHEIPQPTLEELFELDGDYAEALAILDEPAIGFDIQAMLRDTQESLAALTPTQARLLEALPSRALAPLEHGFIRIRPTMTLQDAYHSIPGMDPALDEDEFEA